LKPVRGLDRRTVVHNRVATDNFCAPGFSLWMAQVSVPNVACSPDGYFKRGALTGYVELGAVACNGSSDTMNPNLMTSS
jgi:hypothetical protein